MTSEHTFNGAMFIALCFAVLLRWCVSMHPHSGQGHPPMYGDYEAQRHWMEITYNLPLKDWYFNTTDNDLMYWGLDYPPLTAYHSFICGYVANRVNPAFVALNSSRGYESYEHKVYMRVTVLIADLFIYIPAIWWYFSFKTSPTAAQRSSLKNLGAGDGPKHTTTCDSDSQVLTTYLALIYPGLILIDYGHFQYNNISLGLTVVAIAALCRRFELAASVIFCFALNYKQMELYHAIPFFCYLLGMCLPKQGYQIDFVKLIKIGSVVILSFLLVWLPFLKNLNLTSQVIHRLFPLARGVFEDKVANVWCAVNVIYKLQNAFSNVSMAKICFGTTLLAVFPSSIDLLLRPNLRKFLVALINSSLAFFLFSFQVHEKSILLAAIPMLLYLPSEPLTCFWFLFVSVFSMLPLLIKDGLLLPCIAITLFYMIAMFLTIDFEFKEPELNSTNIEVLVFKSKIVDKGKRLSRKDLEVLPEQIQSHSLLKRLLSIAFVMSITGCTLLTLCISTLKPPSQFPDLYPLLVSVYSCGHFVLFFVYFNYRQFCYNTPTNNKFVK